MILISIIMSQSGLGDNQGMLHIRPCTHLAQLQIVLLHSKYNEEAINKMQSFILHYVV